MKKQFIPIAMKCNKEQFEAIKPYINKEGFRIKHMSEDFDRADYLCNFAWGEKETISNFTTSDYKNFNREVHETWNERIFLEACGIEKKEHFEITKETILKYKMKDEFPEVFDVKLEVGKWYKKPHNKALFFIVGDPEITPFEVYGFDMEGNWMNIEKARTFPNCEIEATEQEVFEALKNEAVKRGLVMGTYCNHKKPTQDQYKPIKDYFYHVIDNCLYGDVENNGGARIFHKGQWAKIIPTKTKEEAEKLLGVKIIS